MAKFKMECGTCGQAIDVKTGLFAPKYFTCRCGHITVAVRIAKEACPNCNDLITYDCSKEMKPSCPSCNYVIDREARFKAATEAEIERRKKGIKRDHFLTVDLTKYFSKNDTTKEDE